MTAYEKNAGSPRASSSAEQAMSTLSAQWYNAITAGLGLSQAQFQLVQGAQPIASQSENLWRIFDSVPPKSVSTYYDPSQLSVFHQNYSGVISALIPQGQLQFEKDMGDYYSAWNDYKSTISPIPSGNDAWLQAFKDWAMAKLPQSQVETCIGDYETMLLDPIAVASNQLIEVKFADKNPGVYAYTTTYNQLQLALNSGEAKAATMDSKTESSDVSNTWAETEAGGIFDIFGIGGESSYESMTVAIAQAGVTIEANFNKVVTLSAGPLSSPSSDTELQNYTPWFDSAALGEGHADSSNTVWKAGDPISWNSTFGPDGNLQRYADAIVVVDGITVTMTSSVSLSTAEQQSFQAAAAGGLFPFFEVETSGGWSNEVTFSDSGSITVTSSCPAGNPQILGVLVSKIEALFS